jgi:hypothetical protein
MPTSVTLRQHTTPPRRPFRSHLGVSAQVVAASLGHVSSTTTIRSYVKPEAAAGAKQRRVLTMLDGGNQHRFKPTSRRKKMNEIVELNGIEPSAS